MTQGSSPAGISDEVAAEYVQIKTLADGRLIGLRRLMFHWTIHVDIDETGYSDRYCFATRQLAQEAFDLWDGTGDPINWHRHPHTGRRRDLSTGREWIEW